MTPGLEDWAARNMVTASAMVELHQMLGAIPPPESRSSSSEARVQSEVRLEGAAKGVRLWRNNVGVLENEFGRPVRYGLANDSAKLNEKIKSSDLIGWRRIVIGPEHVGRAIAQVVARECKPGGWKFDPKDLRERAQAEWLLLVASDGGDACFVTGKGTL